MLSITYPFDEANNYSFLPTKIEVVSSKAQLFPIVVGAEAYLYVKLDENQGLVARDSSGNQRDGAFQGGLDENAWTTGKINNAIEGIGTTGGFINFNQYGNFVTTQAFSLECWIKFTSTATQSFIAKQKNSTPFEGYAINCLTGKPRLVIRDNLNNVISKEHNVAINDNNWHHVVFTYDGSGTTAGCKIYVDNNINSTIIASGTLIGSITNTANLQISGRDGNNNTLDVGTIIDEVVVYDRELTAAEIAFRWNVGAGTQQLPGASTSFPLDNPIIEAVGFIVATEFKGISATINTIGSDEIKGVIVVNGIPKYWNGSAWVDSTGYLESNTVAELNTNASSLLTTRASIMPRWFLHSDDGSTTPEILDYTVSFNLSRDIISFTESVVSSYLLELDGDPISNETIQVRPAWTRGTNITTTGDFISTITEADGFWEITLKIEDVFPDFLEWRIKDKIYKTNFLAGSIRFSDLDVLFESFV